MSKIPVLIWYTKNEYATFNDYSNNDLVYDSAREIKEGLECGGYIFEIKRISFDMFKSTIYREIA